ncbi:MAG: hypothetical protein U1F34_04510 [Gammaproteobacteria bacterium]
MPLIRRRNYGRDLRIVVMSATIDAQPIAHWLGGAPHVTATGRAAFRWVATQHLGCTAVTGPRSKPPAPFYVHCASRRRRWCSCSGAGDGRVQQQLVIGRKRGKRFALYGDLPPTEQECAIAASRAGERKIVLATSIAETGLTRVCGWSLTARPVAVPAL